MTNDQIISKAKLLCFGGWVIVAASAVQMRMATQYDSPIPFVIGFFCCLAAAYCALVNRRIWREAAQRA